MTTGNQSSAPIDLDFLKDISDDPAELRDAVNMCLQLQSERIESLQKALAAGTADEVMKLAHTCAGSTGMYGMGAISAVFRELERLAKAGDLSRGPELMQKIRAEFKRIGDFWEMYQKKA